MSNEYESITVLTSIVGDRDALIEEQNIATGKFVAYVDHPRGSRVWEERTAPSLLVSARRNSRLPKILCHQYVDTKYALWMDANVTLKASVAQLAAEWLPDDEYDFAMFKHHKRTCLYQEAVECASRSLDDPQTILAQASRYLDRGFPRNVGLGETTIILRRNTKKVEEFNNAWWSEYCRHSARDQISVMYAAGLVGMKIKLILPCKTSHPAFSIIDRPAGMEPKPMRK